MDKKYLIPIKNGFLVYQPGYDTVYRGKRKTAKFDYVFIVSAPFWYVVFKPIYEYVTINIWPFLYFTRYRVIIYTTLMVILGVIYYKFIYTKNKEKLLQSQLETVKLIEIKKQLLKDNIKSLISAVLLIVGLFSLCLYDLIHIGLFDKILYSGAVIIYTALLPILTIEVGVIGRFLLVKHLLQLKNKY